MHQPIPWNRTTWKASGRYGHNGKHYLRKILKIIDTYGTYHGDMYCEVSKHLYEATPFHFCSLPLEIK